MRQMESLTGITLEKRDAQLIQPAPQQRQIRDDERIHKMPHEFNTTKKTTPSQRRQHYEGVIAYGILLPGATINSGLMVINAVK